MTVEIKPQFYDIILFIVNKNSNKFQQQEKERDKQKLTNIYNSMVGWMAVCCHS